MTTVKLAPMSLLGGSRTSQVFVSQIGSRLCAVKCIRDSQQGNRRLRRMFPELASRASQYHHKNLARIYKIDADSVQVLMQLFNGSLTREDIETADLLLAVLTDALEGLRYLHDHRVLHLNVKPGNLLKAESGMYCLADPLCTEFGGTTRLGLNPDYRFFAPEHLEPRTPVSPGSDFYSLAMTLAMTVAPEKVKAHVQKSLGREAGAGNIPQPHFPVAKATAAKQNSLWIDWLNSEMENMSFGELCPRLPAPLQRSLDLMIRKHPNERPQSAGEILGMIASLRGQASDDAFGVPSAPQAVRRNWAAGLEVVQLDGESAGVTLYNENNFSVADLRVDGSPETSDAKPGKFSTDGKEWVFHPGGSGRCVINNEATFGDVALRHGDVLRLGPGGPDVIIWRKETEPHKVALAASQSFEQQSERKPSTIEISERPPIPASWQAASKPKNGNRNLVILSIVVGITLLTVLALFLIYLFGGAQ